jgi:hypothetical protein
LINIVRTGGKKQKKPIAVLENLQKEDKNLSKTEEPNKLNN